MGDVIVVYKVLPDSQEHFESVNKAIEALNPIKFEEEEIAFGLKAFKVTVTIPDGVSGAMDEIENKMTSIPNVNSVETLTVSRGI